MRCLAAVTGWWRNRWRKSRHRGPGGRTRVPIPAAVEMPQSVLRALHEKDATLDALVVPGGDVWIVQWREDRPAMADARAMLALCRTAGLPPDRSELLAAAGWERLGVLPYLEGTSAGAVMRLVNRVLAPSAAEIREVMQRRKAAADSSAQALVRTATIRERIRSSSRTDWARTYRGRKVFSRSY